MSDVSQGPASAPQPPPPPPDSGTPSRRRWWRRKAVIIPAVLLSVAAIAAAIVFVVREHEDSKGLQVALIPFVGSWHAHEESLVIQPDGHGRETYPDRSTCPDAPMAGCGIVGTVDFMLTSVSGDTATGAITGASNPKDPIGGPVSIKLVGGGQGLNLTVAGGDQGFPFCNSKDNEAASHYYCGA
jgi:hypothetical protein